MLSAAAAGLAAGADTTCTAVLTWCDLPCTSRHTLVFCAEELSVLGMLSFSAVVEGFFAGSALLCTGCVAFQVLTVMDGWLQRICRNGC